MYTYITHVDKGTKNHVDFLDLVQSVSWALSCGDVKNCLQALTHVSTLRFLLSVRCCFNQWFAEDDLQFYVGFPRIYVSLQEDSGGFQRSSWHVPEKVIPVPKWSPNYTLALLQDVISQVTCCKGPQKIGQPWSAPKSLSRVISEVQLNERGIDRWEKSRVVKLDPRVTQQGSPMITYDHPMFCPLVMTNSLPWFVDGP